MRSTITMGTCKYSLETTPCQEWPSGTTLGPEEIATLTCQKLLRTGSAALPGIIFLPETLARRRSEERATINIFKMNGLSDGKAP